MRQSRYRWAYGALAALGLFGAEETAQALNIDSSAVYARYLNFQGTQDQGPSCFNVAGSMPSGRQTDCSFATLAPAVAHPSTGVYKVKLLNGAPLPANSGDDAGYAVFVTTIGSNALCAETAATIGADNSLTSTIGCVNPAGSAVDAKFAWFYRTDSLTYPQASGYQLNFVYARINRGTPPQTSNSQSFNPFQIGGFFGAGPISTQKLSTGSYRVTLTNVNVASSWGWVDTTYGLSNVIVQRTCTGDNSASCKRTVCNPTAWWLGTQAEDDMTVDVKCYVAGSPVDADFRVLVANQSHSSQGFSGFEQHYGWANAPGFGSGQCLGTDQFLHRNQHEASWENGTPSLEMSMCRTGTGAYTVSFGDPAAFYKSDSAIPIVSSRTAGSYCNVGSVSCGDPNCLIPPAPSVSVRCYNASGSPLNAVWNLSVTY